VVQVVTDHSLDGDLERHLTATQIRTPEPALEAAREVSGPSIPSRSAPARQKLRRLAVAVGARITPAAHPPRISPARHRKSLLSLLRDVFTALARVGPDASRAGDRTLEELKLDVSNDSTCIIFIRKGLAGFGQR